MKGNSAVFYILAMVILQSLMSYAQESERPIARELVSITLNPGSDYTKPGRAKFVAVLSSYCTEILNALPTNTPNEDDWLAAEANTTDTQKIRRLVLSPEWSRHELKTVFEGCRESTANILRAQKSSGKDDTVARYEAAELLRVVINFNDSNNIVTYASQAGLNSTAWKLDFLGSIKRAILVAALRTLENK